MAVENPAACKIGRGVGWEGEEVAAWVYRDGDLSFEPEMAATLRSS